MKNSAGTALDIPMLTDVLLTINIAATHISKQIIGRLRDLKLKDTRFYYFYASNIKKHYMYEKVRSDIVRKSSKSYTIETYYDMLGM